MNEYKGLTSPALSFCCHLHRLCEEHPKQTSTTKPAWGHSATAAHQQEILSLFVPFLCCKSDIPTQWWLPSLLQSSVWFCFSVTLGEAKKSDTTLLSVFLLFKWRNKKLFDFACQSSGSCIWVAVAITNHESDCKAWLSAAQEVVSLWCELAQEEMLQLE